MGMCASVLAIGPFSTSVARYMEYDAPFYRNTREGATVVRELFGIHEGTTASTAFAALLGISNPWDFNTIASTQTALTTTVSWRSSRR